MTVKELKEELNKYDDSLIVNQRIASDIFGSIKHIFKADNVLLIDWKSKWEKNNEA